MNLLTAEQFLRKVWPQKLLTHETLELRAINRNSKVIKRAFFNSAEEFLESAKEYGDGWDIYFGVSTRFKSGGKKIDCYRVNCVWMDLDSRRRRDKFDHFEPVTPDILVKSGKGLHVYWLLEEPVLVRDQRWIEIEAVNRALCNKFNGDIGAIDITRILRVPGFKNYKYNPPLEVKAYSCTD